MQETIHHVLGDIPPAKIESLIIQTDLKDVLKEFKELNETFWQMKEIPPQLVNLIEEFKIFHQKLKEFQEGCSRDFSHIPCIETEVRGIKDAIETMDLNFEFPSQKIEISQIQDEGLKVAIETANKTIGGILWVFVTLICLQGISSFFIGYVFFRLMIMIK